MYISRPTIIVLLIAIALCATGCSNDSSSSSDTYSNAVPNTSSNDAKSPNSASSDQYSSDTTTPSSSSTSVQVGDEGLLSDGSDQVNIATTEQSQHDITDALVAKDEVGFKKVFEDGRAFLVPANTRAKLIGYGSGLMGAEVYHVRIIDGTHADEDGWLPSEYMKKP